MSKWTKTSEWANEQMSKREKNEKNKTKNEKMRKRVNNEKK